ncbi:MAG: N-formylglutamate amidohydrolase [Novosphingobium sp.]
MSRPDHRTADSPRYEGGVIPGAAGDAAFAFSAPRPSTIPLLIAVPHAGRIYPPAVFERMRNPGTTAIRLEDRLVDQLALRVADQTGAALLVAQAPRAMIDLNRAPDDVDWDMFARGRPDRLGSYEPGRRARSGLGLIPRRLPGLGELWKRRHDHSDLEDRISLIHEPYHTCLERELSRLRDRWGAALLLDLHSMPPLPKQGGDWPAEFVLGDRFGASCSGAIVASTFSYFSEMRRAIAHNRPYAGGYVLERHASPDAGVHAFQLEIDRTSYLDPHQAEPGAGFAAMVHLLTGLVRRLAAEAAELGRLARPGEANWAEAAE